MGHQELHVHLEGALSLDFLLSVHQEKNPEFTHDNLISLFDYQDFRGFIGVWISHQKLLFQNSVSWEKRVHLMVQDFFERLEREKIEYTEAHISPIDALWCVYGPLVTKNPERYQELLLAWDCAFNYWNHRSTNKARYIIDLVLNYPQEIMLWQWQNLKELLPRLTSIAGIGIGGGNSQRQRISFKDVFWEARSLGLLTVCHAGELPPKIEAEEEVSQALEIGAQRIGHGIHGISDPKILERLAVNQVIVEISPSSNLFTKSIQSLEELPFFLLKEWQIPFCINSDDPTYFHTTLAREIKLVEAFL